MSCRYRGIAPDAHRASGSATTQTAAKVLHMLRNIQVLGVAALLLGASTSHGSPAGQAPIEVSLTIQETCVIQSAVNSATTGTPGVSCLHGTPYSVALEPGKSTEPTSSLQLADRTAQRAIWTVVF